MPVKSLVCVLALFSTASLARAAISFDTPNTAALAEELAAAGAALPEARPSPGRQAAGEVLVPAKTVQLRVVQNSLDLADYTASMSLYCSYKAGLVWPESYSCGKRELPVELTAGGRLLIPAIEAFEGAHGGNLANFDMLVTLREKGDSRGYLFSLSVHGKAAFAAYKREDAVLNVLKLNEARLEVLVDGEPLAGSELAKDAKASLLSSVTSAFKPGDVEAVNLVSPLEVPQSYDNKDHGYARQSLAELKELVVKSAALVEKAGDERPLTLRATLRWDNPPGVSARTYQARIEVAKTADGLSSLDRLNLIRIQ